MNIQHVRRENRPAQQGLNDFDDFQNVEPNGIPILNDEGHVVGYKFDAPTGLELAGGSTPDIEGSIPEVASFIEEIATILEPGNDYVGIPPVEGSMVTGPPLELSFDDVFNHHSRSRRLR